ncbi:MAG TPA: Crp/Fnr family transcriptional regulator [Mycobacteriales bacterium]|nr:Crp/Fnr family transcriptional regulator [Mycobacteriales bacterium]
MSRESVVHTLRAAPLFACLDDAQIARLAESSRVRSYRKGQLVFQYDEVGDSLAVIASGRVKVAVRSADGGELALASLGPGDAIGELSIVDGGRRSADVESSVPTDVILIERETVLALMKAEPALTTSVLRVIAGSMRRLTEAAADLVFLDLPRRIAKWLLEQPRDVEGRIDAVTSQEEIAHHVAGTRQSVNAALRGFERRGWVRSEGRRLIIGDVGALSRFAGL